MSKVILLGAHQTGVKMAEYFAHSQEDELIAVYQSGNAAIDELIAAKSQIKPSRLFSSNELNNPEHINWLKAEGVDFIISVYWPYMISDEVLALARKNTVNLHPSLLPYNRGSFPHLFVLLENSPCGVSLHQLTSKLDTGAIWAQKEVKVLPHDTALSLYEKLQDEVVDLFKNYWPKIKANEIQAVVQDESKATCHKEKDIIAYNQIDLDKKYTGREWLNLLRARSLGDLGFAYFEEEGQKIYINLRLGKDEDFSAS
jgi:methionyl-tRNA formyltransferase